MRKKERYEKILAWFRENVPVAETELHYDNPFELLIAVILSAQCTDKRVNMITSRSTRRCYSRRGIRIYPQRLLSQQQSQTSCRHGTDVGERIQQ